MGFKKIAGLFFVILVLPFIAGCGAGMVTVDPTLPWEVTETVDPGAAPDDPTETATLPVEDTPTATLPVEDTPTATLTPTEPLPAEPSQTPTQVPAAQIAPPDSNFNNPLTIPLDSTASVTDFVSFPGGDTIDRVRYDVSGMNSNASLSGGRARLTLAVSCFGAGLENITFFTAGQTFTCGQTIVDQEVTFDSRTGTVTIEAIGGQGTYVQWVLTGTAVRVN